MTPLSTKAKCTKEDYRELFASSVEPLSWLCYTLTGNRELSEKVLDAALEQSLKGAEHVFREWMVRWARRLIIRVCIDFTKPWNEAPSQAAYSVSPILERANREHLADLVALPGDLLQQKLLQHDSLLRFVFVLRALEGYSRRETALLLNIDDRTCEWIYVRAIRSLRSGVEDEVFWKSSWTSEIDYSLVQAGN